MPAQKGSTPWNKGKRVYMGSNRTSFKKGQIAWNKGTHGLMAVPWNKGKRLSEELRKKLSLAHKGQIPWHKGKTGMYSDLQIQQMRARMLGKPSPMKGKKHTEEARKKMSLSRIGLQNNLGKHHSEETKEKLRVARSKQKFPMKDTLIEQKLHHLLDSLNLKYHKHFPVYHHKMDYHQVDIMFVDHEGNPKIAIECDGCYFHNCLEHHPNSKIGKKNKQRDRLIDECMKELGIKVIRLWEHDIKEGKIPMEVYQEVVR